MAQSFSTAQPGLYLDPNPLGNAPDGALAQADNCVIRYAGILESRRGFALHSAHTGFQSLGAFGSTLVAADPFGTSKAYYYDGASWVSLGSISSPPVSNPRNQFFTSKGALYVTSGGGLLRTDSTADQLQPAGLIRAAPFLFPTSTVNFTAAVSSADILPSNAAVAYRTVYQRQVGDLFDIISPPSAPLTVVNISGGTETPIITIPVGPQLTVGDTIQLYRTEVALSGIPSAEFFLVQQIPVTAAILANGLRFTDQVPDANLGAALYTNASEEGAAQENNPPPLSGDVCQFLGYTIYANTTGYQAMTLQLGALLSANGLFPGDVLTFNVGSNVSLVAGTDFGKTSDLSGDTVTTVLQTLQDAINANSTLNKHMQASAFVGSRSLLLEAISPDIAQWSLTFSANTLPIAIGALVAQGGLTVRTSAVFAAGVQFDLEPVSTLDPNFPAGIYTLIDYVAGMHSDYNNALSLTMGTSNIHAYTIKHAYPWLPWVVQGQITTTPGLYYSSAGADAAGLSFSKFQQPEAVPLENSLTIGNPTFPVLRVVPLRQSVLVFKGGDGVWQLTGTDPGTFTAVPYDLTVQLAQPWSAAAVNDTVCFLSSKGPLGMGESGGAFPLAPSGFDCPIREELLEVLTLTQADTTFGFGYESEKFYILWTPLENGDSYQYCRQAWVFNLSTAAWTRWPLDAQAGFVNATGDNKIYYANGADVLVERKDYTTTDYQDVGGSVTIASVSGNTLTFGSTPVLAPGDFVTQGGSNGYVLSVSGLTVTLIQTSGTFTAGAATYQRAITCTVQRLPWAGVDKNPGINHRFQEVAYNFRLFQSPFLNITASTSLNGSDPDSYLVYPTTGGYGVNLRKGFNPNNTQAILLQTGFVFAGALCNFNLQSTSLVDEPVSTRTSGG